MAAAFAGAAAVLGIDSDADAVAAAERSARLNPLPPTIRFAVGDVAVPETTAEVVLANLTGAMLIRDAGHLARWVAPGGHLVVSGFMDDERAAVEAGLAPAFDVRARLDDDGWCGLTLRRR